MSLNRGGGLNGACGVTKMSPACAYQQVMEQVRKKLDFWILLKIIKFNKKMNSLKAIFSMVRQGTQKLGFGYFVPPLFSNRVVQRFISLPPN